MRRLSLLSLALLLAAACREELPITGAEPEPREQVPPGVLVEGTVEKGPFVDGTVTVGPLDGGAAVTTAIQDGLGTYALRVPAAPVYRIEAKGRAYRETAGTVWATPVVLRALHVATGDRERVHVNVLTSLAHDRAALLVGEGVAPADALARAGDEVHRALGVGVPFHEPTLPASTRSMFGADDDDHAYLFAVATVLDRAAGSEDLGGFLATLSADLAPDGELSMDLAIRLDIAGRQVDADRVTAGLRAWLERTGHGEVIVPDLRRILDSDGDGIPDGVDSLEVAPSRLAIVRTGRGEPDRAVGSTGAVLPGCPPATVELFDRAAGGVPVAAGAADAGGSFALPFGSAEASRPRLWLEAADACGARSARVAIETGVDETPPTLVPDAFAIVRRGLEAPDGVRAQAGAVADGEGPVVSVVFAGGPDAARVAAASPRADGGLDEVPVGTADVAPSRLWAEAVDKAGNVSPRVELAAGSATAPPAVDLAAVAVLRRGMGAVDGVRGAPGAAAGVCRPVEVRLFAAVGGPPSTAAVDADGGFEELPVGTETSTPARLWIQAVDKCGQSGEAVELESARDLEGPAIDPALVVWDATGLWDEAVGLPGAIADGSGVAEVRLHDAACDARLATLDGVEADGSFPAAELGDQAASEVSVCVVATDKAGNVSPGVRSRRVRTEVDGRTRPEGGRPDFAIFAGGFDVDPRTVSPGHGAWASTRLDEASRIALANGFLLETSASAETRDVPLAWRWLDLSVPAPDVAAATSWPSPPTVVRTMGDWPWLVTLQLRCTAPFCAGWTWDVAEVEGPSRREGMAVMAAPDGDLLAFGGTDGPVRLADTWLFQRFGGWYQLAGAGGPAAAAVRLAHDPVRDRPLLFAAVEGDPALQLWELGADGSWVRVAATGGPSFRTGFGVAAHPARGHVVLFGGRDAAGTALGDTWLWNGSSWTSPALITNPPARWGHGMAFWESRDAVFLRGGSAAGPLDGWAWDGVRWSHLDSDGREGGVGVAMAVERSADRLFTFHTSTPQGATAPLFTVRHEDASGSGYDEYPGPPAGAGGTVAWNPAAQDVTLQARLTGPYPLQQGLGWYWGGGGTWQFAVADDFTTAASRTMVVDTHRGVRLDLGRNDDGHGRALDERGNRVAFDVPDWPAGVTPRYVYDAVGARTIGVGGGESWALRAVEVGGAVAWSPLTGTPPGAVELAFDPRRGRVVAFDGAGTWELAGEAWAFTAAAPAACPGGSLLFDPVAGKLLKLAGGGCALECHYDGAWSCGGVQAPGPDLVGAPDVAEGILLAHGAGARTWIREGVIPHERYVVQSVSVGLPPGSTALAAEVVATSRGRGSLPPPGGAGYGFELLAWNWAEARWVSLATAAGSGSLTRSAALGGEPGPYLRDGRLWVQLVPLLPSAPPGGAGPAYLATSKFTLEVEYLLPPEP